MTATVPVRADDAGKLGLEVVVPPGATKTNCVGRNARIANLSNQDLIPWAVVPVGCGDTITPLIPLGRQDILILNLDSGPDHHAVDEAGLKTAGAVAEPAASEQVA